MVVCRGTRILLYTTAVVFKHRSAIAVLVAQASHPANQTAPDHGAPGIRSSAASMVVMGRHGCIGWRADRIAG